jgi:hypothetical protein
MEGPLSMYLTARVPDSTCSKGGATVFRPSAKSGWGGDEMYECQMCGDEIDEIFRVEVEGRVRRVCEDCADRLREEREIAEESADVLREMMGFRG